MPQREFDITIEPNGLVQLQVKGYKGKRCKDVAKVFEKIIGQIQSEQQTSEFYEPDELVQYHIENKGQDR